MTTNDAASKPWFSGTLAAWLGWLVLSVYTLSAAIVPVRSDNDIWWHLKSGEYIAANGIPKHDVFNFKAEDLEWHNHEWLSQVILYEAAHVLDRMGLGEIRGAILFNALIIWLTITLVYTMSRYLSGRWVVAFLVSVACVAIGRRMFYVRPPTITNLMLVLEMMLLIGVNEGRIRRGWLWLLVPGIALWTNLHGGWMAGGVVLGCWAIGQAMAIFKDRLPRVPIDPPPVTLSFASLAALLPACLLATFCNPYIYHLYELPKRVLSDALLVQSIGELASPNFFFVIDFELWTLALFAIALMVRSRRVSIFEILIFFFFLHQAMQHVRHLSLFAIMMVPVASRLLGAALDMKESALRDHWPRLLRTPSIATAAIGCLFASWVLINPREGGMWSQPLTERSYPGRNLQWAAQPEGYVREAFPARLCDFVELADISGPMFNQNYYAGYLIWRLSPDRSRVFSDSRFDIFGGDLMRLENRIVGADPTPVEHDGKQVPFWRAALSDVDWVIAKQNTALWYELHQQAGASAEWLGLASFPENDLEVWIRATPENVAAEGRWESARRLVNAAKP
ncbi:hypothetical protein GC173_06665 [bacterium]|nr:hypothetical protein [bacterium]